MAEFTRLLQIEVLELRRVRVRHPRHSHVATTTPARPIQRTPSVPELSAWFAVRQEWIDNDGHVTPHFLELERQAHAATDRNSQ